MTSSQPLYEGAPHVVLLSRHKASLTLAQASLGCHGVVSRVSMGCLVPVCLVCPCDLSLLIMAVLRKADRWQKESDGLITADYVLSTWFFGI